MTWQHNPGSPEAKERGCTCGWMDNNQGHGLIWGDKTVWSINADCPLHATEDECS